MATRVGRTSSSCARSTASWPAGYSPRSTVEPPEQGLDRGAELVLFAHELLDALLGVDDRRMVLAAELLADGGVAETGDPPRQVHRHLPSAGDALLAAISLDVLGLDLHLLADRLDDLLDVGLVPPHDQHRLQHVLRQVDGDRRLGQGGEGSEADERPLQLAD